MGNNPGYCCCHPDTPLGEPLGTEAPGWAAAMRVGAVGPKEEEMKSNDNAPPGRPPMPGQAQQQNAGATHPAPSAPPADQV